MLAHATPGVEWGVSDNGYGRTITGPGIEGCLLLEPTPSKNSVRVEVALSKTPSASGLSWIRRRISHLLDLDAPMMEVRSRLDQQPRIGRLVRQRPGLRVPGCWDPFELSVRTIVGQQVSLAGANTLSGRMVRQLGRRLAQRRWPRTMASDAIFPDAMHLATASLARLGLTKSRMHTIRRLARAVCDLQLDFDNPPDRTALLAFRGVGPWTVEYVLMRGYHAEDAFPSSDLALRKAFGEPGWSERALLTEAQAWRPYRAYAAMHLWRHYLDRKAKKSVQSQRRSPIN